MFWAQESPRCVCVCVCASVCLSFHLLFSLGQTSFVLLLLFFYHLFIFLYVFFSWLFRKGQRRRLIASLASKMFAGQVIKKAQKSVCAELLLLCLRCIKPRINVSKTTANNSNNSNWLLFGLITRQSSKRSSQNNNNNKTHKNYYEKPTKNQSTAFWHWQWTVPNYREKREREGGREEEGERLSTTTTTRGSNSFRPAKCA